LVERHGRAVCEPCSILVPNGANRWNE
jgi:hypothetical protein